ncbi:MAG: acyl-CoA dehydrogenase family protein [Myxococcales bacterium]|nr:acyl-CoA dehydrogenase family protein [Myxococcales bacterium]
MGARSVIDFEPSDEQQLIVETLHQFAAREIRPRARACDESGALPHDVLHAAQALGLVTNALDAAAGGDGDGRAVTAALIAEELAWGDLAIGCAILSPQLLALPIADHGSQAQQARWLPAFQGERFVPGALAVLEPGFGADVFAPATRAQRDGEAWLLDGDKCLVPWIEGGEHVLVTASSEAGARGFVVARDAPGLSATPERNLGLAGLPTVALSLQRVRVPEADALACDDGRSVRRVLTRARVGLAAAAVGVARAAYEIARDYAKERHAFGAPIATKQAIAFRLADMAIEIDAARLLTWEAAWRLDQGDDAEREAALAQQQTRRVALEVADGAVQVLGGYGYIRDQLPEMQLRNARGFACFEGLALV